MSDDNSKDKFDDFQKHLQSMFRNLGSSGINIFADDQEPQVVEEEDDEFEEEESEALEAVYSFNLRPRDVKAYLDRYVIKQDEAKKVLAVAICDHYNHVRRCLDNDELDEREYAKQNVLLLGPTGVGKTEQPRPIGSDRPALNVIRANEVELAAHVERLGAIDKASGGQCVWLKPEQ